MRRISFVLASSILSLAAWSSPGLAGDEVTPAHRDEALRRHGLDPASPLDSRVTPTSPAVLKMFEELGGPAPTAHVLTEAERLKLSAAFAALPPLHRRVLSERLRSVSFLDGMPNTALTSPVDTDDPYRLFDITVRAGIFDEDASQWFTWKERTNFDASNSSLAVSVDVGKLDAILYVLLHEATHVVDACLRITPGAPPEGGPAASDFTRGIWDERLVSSPRYRDALLGLTTYRDGGKVLPVGEAEAVYAALRRTPFASLYGSNNWLDDLAEYVALYHLTEVLKQPYRISIRDKGVEVSSYEPMKSDLVRGRVGLMKRFYEGGQ